MKNSGKSAATLKRIGRELTLNNTRFPIAPVAAGSSTRSPATQVAIGVFALVQDLRELDF
jgi:hypothetical protein